MMLAITHLAHGVICARAEPAHIPLGDNSYKEINMSMTYMAQARALLAVGLRQLPLAGGMVGAVAANVAAVGMINHFAYRFVVGSGGDVSAFLAVPMRAANGLIKVAVWGQQVLETFGLM